MNESFKFLVKDIVKYSLLFFYIASSKITHKIYVVNHPCNVSDVYNTLNG